MVGCGGPLGLSPAPVPLSPASFALASFELAFWVAASFAGASGAGVAVGAASFGCCSACAGASPGFASLSEGPAGLGGFFRRQFYCECGGRPRNLTSLLAQDFQKSGLRSGPKIVCREHICGRTFLGRLWDGALGFQIKIFEEEFC